MAEATTSEWVVTETLDDPSLNPYWVGQARDAMHALDQWAEQEGFVPYSECVKEEEDGASLIGTEILWPEPRPMPPGSLWAIFTNTTVYAIPVSPNHEEEMIDMQESRHGRRRHARPDITKTVAKIEASISDWEEGRMTSPDDRDHVIAACEVLGVDWHQIDRDTDNDIVGKIANEIYEDSGETITDIPDLATYILTRLFQEGLRPVEGETLQEPKAEDEEPLMREFLVHVNVQIECEKEDIDVETVQREIAGALEVGLGDMSHTPHLQGAEVEISLAEEI